MQILTAAEMAATDRRTTEQFGVAAAVPDGECGDGGRALLPALGLQRLSTS